MHRTVTLLLAPDDRLALHAVLAPAFPLAGWISGSASRHLHIRVEDTASLPVDRFSAAGFSRTLDRPGFVEFAAGPELTFSFSSIPIAEDERLSARLRPRPFLDHVGFDLPEDVSLAEVASAAGALGWCVVRQCGDGRAVACCFEVVAEKLWVFPDGLAAEVAIEFSRGQHTSTDEMGGDLRPVRPSCCERLIAGPGDELSGGSGLFS